MKELNIKENSRKLYLFKIIVIISIIILLSLLLSIKITSILDIFGIEITIFDWLFIIFLLIPIIFLISISLSITFNQFRDYFKKKTVPLQLNYYLSFNDIFENENRKKIINQILEKPGIHNNELLRQCNLQKGQLQWHLHILLRYGIIRKEKIGQYVVFFPNIVNLKENDDSHLFLIKSKTSLKILDIIEKNPGIFSSKIARQLNLKRSSVKYHIDKLFEKNLISLKRIGRKISLYPNQNGLFQ